MFENSTTPSSISPDTFPTFDIENGILRAWWVEPLIATLTFAISINIYWYEERKRGLSSEKFFPGSFSNSCPVLLSFIGYWVGVFVWKTIVPPPSNFIPDGLVHDLPSLFLLGCEIVSGIILYDFFFFLIHWGMHFFSVLKPFHRRHHSSPEGTLEARDVLRHSIIDGSLQVLTNIMVQRYTPWGAVKSRLGRAIHNIVVVWMLTESHSASPYPNIFRRWCVGVREHRLHHLGEIPQEDDDGKEKGFYHQQQQQKQQKGGVYHYHRYQQFFGYLDDLRFLFQSSGEIKKER